MSHSSRRPDAPDGPAGGGSPPETTALPRNEARAGSNFHRLRLVGRALLCGIAEQALAEEERADVWREVAGAVHGEVVLVEEGEGAGAWDAR